NADAMSLGSATAPVQLVEYASAACSHCAHFHATNWATLKTNYIDTGRVRLTLSEMLTPPPAVAFGMFQLARCGNADAPEYFRRLGILFERQHAILETGTMGGVVTSLVAAGAEWGLTEPQVMASFNDEAGRERMMRSLNAADAAGVNSTPAFFLNGQRLGDDFQNPAVMTRTLDAALNR
ncbi:MAG: thioredoxin domain-containing protein, partial [Terricaulis sp.]